MRKTILFLLCIALFASLAACNSVEKLDPQRDNLAPSTTAPTDKTTVATTPSTSSTSNLSFEDYIEWLNELAKRRNVGGVTNLTGSNLGEKPNEGTYSCDYAGGLVHLNIYAKDGQIANVFSTVSPYTLVDRGECANLSDAQVSAHALAIVSIWGINESWNYEWHVQRFTEATEQGNNSSLKRTYTKDNWTFTVVMGNALVSVSASNNNIS